MSLKMRRLGGWSGKLFSAFLGVNVACAGGMRALPDDVIAAAREGDAAASRAMVDAALVERPAQVWRTKAGRGIAGAPAVTPRVIIVTTTDRFLYAIDVRTGATFWRRRGDGVYSAGPILIGDRIITASEQTGGRVTALQLRDGRRVWQTQTGDVSAPLAAGDSMVFGVTDGGRAFAIEASGGRLRWQRTVGPSRSGAVVAGGRVLFATLRDTIVVLDAADGSVVASVRAPATTTTPLTRLDDSTVVLASPEGSVHAIDISSGRARWSASLGEPAVGWPVLVRDTVFVHGDACSLFGIHPRSGVIVHRQARVSCVTSAAPAILRRGVLVATVSGDLVFYDRHGSTPRWRVAIERPVRHAPTIQNEWLVVTALSGEIFGFR